MTAIVVERPLNRGIFPRDVSLIIEQAIDGLTSSVGNNCCLGGDVGRRTSDVGPSGFTSREVRRQGGAEVSSQFAPAIKAAVHFNRSAPPFSSRRGEFICCGEVSKLGLYSSCALRALELARFTPATCCKFREILFCFEPAIN